MSRSARNVATSSGDCARDVEAERRHAPVHRRGGRRARRSSGSPARKRSPSARSCAEHRVPAERVDVVDRRDEAGEQLVLARAELEAVPDRLVRGRPHLVRAPGLEQLALPEREPHVRAEVLVRRADEDVDVPRGDVDRPVRARSGRRRPRRARRPRARARRSRRTSGAVPTEFAATGNATTRVRSESCASRSS